MMEKSSENSEIPAAFRAEPALPLHGIHCCFSRLLCISSLTETPNMLPNILQILIALTLLSATIIGCSRDPNANTTEITPELKEKIKQEDAAVDAAEGGKGAIRN